MVLGPVDVQRGDLGLVHLAQGDAGQQREPGVGATADRHQHPLHGQGPLSGPRPRTDQEEVGRRLGGQVVEHRAEKPGTSAAETGPLDQDQVAAVLVDRLADSQRDVVADAHLDGEARCAAPGLWASMVAIQRSRSCRRCATWAARLSVCRPRHLDHAEHVALPGVRRRKERRPPRAPRLRSGLAVSGPAAAFAPRSGPLQLIGIRPSQRRVPRERGRVPAWVGQEATYGATRSAVGTSRPESARSATRRLGAQAHHLAARRLRSSFTQRCCAHSGARRRPTIWRTWTPTRSPRIGGSGLSAWRTPARRGAGQLADLFPAPRHALQLAGERSFSAFSVRFSRSSWPTMSLVSETISSRLWLAALRLRRITTRSMIFAAAGEGLWPPSRRPAPMARA